MLEIIYKIIYNMAISGLSSYQIIRYKDLTLGGNYSYNGMTTMDVIPDKMLVTSKMFTIVGEDAPTPTITQYRYNVSVEIDGDIYVLIPSSDYTGANNHAFFVPYTVADSMSGSMDIEVGMEPYNDWFVRFCSVEYPYALNGSDEYTFSNCSITFDEAHLTEIFSQGQGITTSIKNLGNSYSFTGYKLHLGNGGVYYYDSFSLSSASTASQIIGLELSINDANDNFRATSVVFDNGDVYQSKNSASIFQLKIKQDGTVVSHTCDTTEFAYYEIETSSEVSNGIKTTNITIAIPEITFIKQ